MRAHDARIDVTQRVVGEPEHRRLVAAQVVEHAVGAAREIAEYGAPAVAAQVERDRTLVAIEGLEELAVARAEEVGSDVAPHVAAFAQVLHLDHLGAEDGQVHGAGRAGAVLLDREDAQAREGKRVVHRGRLYNCPDKSRRPAWRARITTRISRWARPTRTAPAALSARRTTPGSRYSP